MNDFHPGVSTESDESIAGWVHLFGLGEKNLSLRSNILLSVAFTASSLPKGTPQEVKRISRNEGKAELFGEGLGIIH